MLGCVTRRVPLTEIPMVAAWYFPNTENYINNIGVDLLARDDYIAGNPLQLLRRNHTAAKHFTHGECVEPAADAAWSHQVLGPFLSHGGNNWWMLWLHDIGRLESQKLLPAAVVEHFIGAVDPLGTPISYPPLHLHHLGIRTSLFLSPFHSSHCYIFGECSIDESRIIGQAGDFQCSASGDHQDAMDSTRCLTRTYEGAAKEASAAWNGEVMYNDVRPARSLVLSWNMRFSFKLTPLSSTTLLSIHRTKASWPRIEPPDKVSQYYVDAGQSYLYYCASMPSSGTMLPTVSFFHAHQLLLDFTVIFSGLPEHVGIGKRIPAMEQPCRPEDTRKSGFNRNEDLRQLLIYQIQSLNLTLICNVQSNFAKIAGNNFDRHAVHQCVPWAFKRADQLTVFVFLNKRNLQSSYQHSPFYLHYVPSDTDGHSHYTDQHVAHYPIHFRHVTCRLDIFLDPLRSGPCAMVPVISIHLIEHVQLFFQVLKELAVWVLCTAVLLMIIFVSISRSFTLHVFALACGALFCILLQLYVFVALPQLMLPISGVNLNAVSIEDAVMSAFSCTSLPIVFIASFFGCCCLRAEKRAVESGRPSQLL